MNGRVLTNDEIDFSVPPPTVVVAERSGLFASAVAVMAAPRPVEIVESTVWADSVSVVVSESGAGKTFLLHGLGAAISDGVAWHGRRVRQGSVASVSYEGDAHGVRLRALQAHGHRLDHFYILRASEPLSPIIDRDRMEIASRGEAAVACALDSLRDELAAANRPPIVLLVIDTVRASMTGSEDSSESVSAYLRVVRRLLTHVPGAGAILAHHSGWQDGEEKRKRERGSSAWRGNVDGTLYLEAGEYDAERGERRLTLHALKVRDAEAPSPLHLIRRRVELPESASQDIRDGALTSCVIVRDDRTRADRDAEQAQAEAAQHLEIDRRTLRALVDHPEIATSQEGIRVMLGVRKVIVSSSLSRLIAAGCVTPGGRLRPYQPTAAGLQFLGGAS